MIDFAIIGIGNYGAVHLDVARRVTDAGLARLTAVADIKLSAYPEVVSELRGRGVACYQTHREMLDRHPELALVTLPLPIHLHAPLTIECLERGLHVLVEKPPAPTLADAQRMAEAARRTGRLCGVGFQQSTSPLLHAMCEIVAAGKLGAIRELAALSLGKRYDNYYARAAWSGKISLHGAIVRDGTLNNPFAHTAQSLLTVAGAAAGVPARSVRMERELYAGHDIETEDTCALRAELDSGAALHFITSVCAHEAFDQQFRIVGTAGEITFDNQRDPQTQVRYRDGAVEALPPLVVGEEGTAVAVLRNFIDVLEGRAPALACPIDATLAFAELVEQFFTGASVVHLHGTPHVTRVELDDGGRREVATYLDGIEGYARAAYAAGKLFSEVGAPWARKDGDR